MGDSCVYLNECERTEQCARVPKAKRQQHLSFYEAITDNEGLAKGSALHVNQGLLECNHKDVGVRVRVTREQVKGSADET